MNSKKPDNGAFQELVQLPNPEYARPAVPEMVVGEYYYGHAPSRSAVARAYWQLFQRRSGLMLGTFLLLLVLGSAWLFTRPREYRASAEILVSPAERGAIVTGDLPTDISNIARVRSVTTEIKMLRSPDLLDMAFASLSTAMRQHGFHTTATRLKSYPITIDNPKDADIVGVEVTALDPQAAADFANAIMATHLKLRQLTMQGMADSATRHVTNQLELCDRELNATLNALAALKTARGITDIATASTTDAAALSRLEEDITASRAAMAQSQEKRIMLQRQLGTTSAVIETSRTVAENPLVGSIDADLERLRQKRTELLGEYQATAPEVVAVDQQIAEMTRRLNDAMQKHAQTVVVGRNELKNRLMEQYIDASVTEREARSRLELTSVEAERIRGRLATLPRSERDLSLLIGRKQELEETHALLTRQQNALRLTMQAGLPGVMQVTKARANSLPASPKIPASLVLIVILSAAIAVGVAVARDQFDERIHTSDTLEVVSGRRILGELPKVKNGFSGLVTEAGCPPSLLESFRILRGNILLAMPAPLPRLIMVTSARAGEGKSTTIANLAASIAMSGKRVLIIDCDLRHPSLHTIYNLPNYTGLSLVLEGEVDGESAIRETGIARLSVMTSGPKPAYPPEMLSSPEFPVLLEWLRESYDCILLDSTPLVNLSDGAMLAAHAEGVIVVVSSDRTRVQDLQASLRILEQVGAPILGLVYNRSEDIAAVRWQGNQD